ncbi:MAG TPA: hypothetical protein VLT17_05100 [Gemmatimonadales bacterium]|jgi:hypothetical protein|nr:hypothetical protein [Gemmatimonadales bacterium]
MTRYSTAALLLMLVALTTSACTESRTAGTGRTEREKDSLIGQSKIPGASAVKRAMAASDSAQNRATQEDSASTSP